MRHPTFTEMGQFVFSGVQIPPRDLLYLIL